MASVRHRCPKPGCKGRNCTKGNWHWQVRVSGALPVHGFAPNKTDAEHDASDTESRIRRELREGTYNAAPKVEQTKTLATLIDKYVSDVLPDKDRNKSADTVIQQLEWWKLRGGKRLLSQVTTQWVSEQKVYLRKNGTGLTRYGRPTPPLSKSSVNRYLAALSSAYTGVKRALHWKVANPVKEVEKYSEALSTDKIFSAVAEGRRGRYLDPVREFPALILAARVHGVLPWVVLGICTGARRGSIERLRWDNVHVNEGGRSWVEFVDTKNGESYAVDVVDGEVLKPASLLKELMDVTPREDGLVVGRMPIRRWKKALKAAGVEQFVFHNLRHTAASYASMAGVSGRDLQQMMGWKTAAMATRYVHLTAEHTAKIAQQLMGKM